MTKIVGFLQRLNSVSRIKCLLLRRTVILQSKPARAVLQWLVSLSPKWGTKGMAARVPFHLFVRAFGYVSLWRSSNRKSRGWKGTQGLHTRTNRKIAYRRKGREEALGWCSCTWPNFCGFRFSSLQCYQLIWRSTGARLYAALFFQLSVPRPVSFRPET